MNPCLKCLSEGKLVTTGFYFRRNHGSYAVLPLVLLVSDAVSWSSMFTGMCFTNRTCPRFALLYAANIWVKSSTCASVLHYQCSIRMAAPRPRRLRDSVLMEAKSSLRGLLSVPTRSGRMLPNSSWLVGMGYSAKVRYGFGRRCKREWSFVDRISR
jgi:hypothetical protein